MLTALSIRDIVIIERLDLEFGRGLTVLSGETGAGKSILLDSLSLALGGRGDAGLVRQGAGQGSVSASFHVASLPNAIGALADEHGLDIDGEIVLRRLQYADGRTRGFLNDEPVSARLMKEVGAALVEIHGQHDERALLEPAAHLRLLDAFGGLETPLATVRARWQAWAAAGRDLATHQAEIAEAARDTEFLTAALTELDALAPAPGEEARLATERQAMIEGERIAEDLAAANEAISGETGVEAGLSRALRALERASGRAAATLAPALEALTRANVELEEGRAALDDVLSRIEPDPARLEAAEERLFALRAVARKHGVGVDDLADLTGKLRARLDAIEGGEERLAALRRAEAEAREAYLKAAQTLGAKRLKAAKSLDTAIMAELKPLKLENARFETALETLDIESGGPLGLDRAEFTIAANPGSAAGPLRKVASGGELSRVMLALKVVLAGVGGAPTLVFDEIDSGVGGAVAHAVGERLARLGAEAQVLVVTHSPQVAARAASHLLIEKAASAGSDAVQTCVTPLDARDRTEEVARMLAGAAVTAEARAAAAKLIAGEV